MQAWEKFLKLQEKELGSETVRRWLRSLRVIDYDAANLYLEAKDSFQILWFEEHIREKAANFLRNNNRRPIQVHLAIAGQIQPTQSIAKQTRRKNVTAVPNLNVQFDEPDPLCRFEHFVITEGNLLAHKILCELAGLRLSGQTSSHSESQLAVFNPIYVYGNKGVGKTHLLMATAQAISDTGLDVAYVRAETFTDHVVQAIRVGQMPEFRRAYRTRDVLIVDDVHVLSRKAATQEEFFHTFNTLHLAGKQVILSADCAPQELQSIEPRLVSRFEWGIALPLEAYGKKELSAVLQAKAQALQLKLTPGVEEHICRSFSSGAHTIGGALKTLVLRLHMKNREASRPMAAEQLTPGHVDDFLRDLLEEEQHSALDPKAIVSIVATAYGIPVDDILGKSQSRECVRPRQLAMYICRQLLSLPYAKIGDYFKRDHSTVLASVRQIEERLQGPEAELSGELSRIMRQLQT